MLDSLRHAKQQFSFRFEDLVRRLTYSKEKDGIINKKEIRVIGLRRCGNHAIINWIRKQHTGNVWHLNNLLAKENPYRFADFHYPNQRFYPEAKGNFTKKDCLLYSYEDYGLEQVVDPYFERMHDIYLGQSSQRYDVVILRDPFNLFASRLKSKKIAVKAPNKNVVDLWLVYAQEYLGKTNYLIHNKIFIKYNDWFSNLEYRQKIAAQLNFEFTDAGFEEVKGYGGGSSFEGQTLDGKATQMNVLERWKKFADDPEYQKLFDNPELLDYSQQIFGHLPGTEVLFR